MGAAVGGMDIVGKGDQQLIVAFVILHGHLGLGALLIVVGIFLLRGASWARWTAVGLAGLVAFAWFPQLPLGVGLLLWVVAGTGMGLAMPSSAVAVMSLSSRYEQGRNQSSMQVAESVGNSVITAVGMVDHLAVMMVAVVIAMAVMLLASRPLTQFVNAHPTVVVLCLSFLLMIGLSLLAEGLGFHLPKGYLYAAIGFSILIEFFNQWAKRNMLRNEARIPLRERTADSILRMLGGRSSTGNDGASAHTDPEQAPAFGQQERHMVSGVLSLAERSVQSVMTPRADIQWLDLDQPAEALHATLLEMRHGLFPVAHGELDRLAGVARSRDMLFDVLANGQIDLQRSLRQPLVVPASVNVVKLVEQMRHSRAQVALISDEFGSILGLVTPMDLLEAIAGEFPDEDELEAAAESLEDGSMILEGSTDIRHVSLLLGKDLVDESEEYSTLSGYLLFHLGRLPENGETVEADGYRFEVVTMDGHKIEKVRIIAEEKQAEK